jgi:hypothetical protein
MFKTYVESCILKTVEILLDLNWGCFTQFLEIIRYFSKNLADCLLQVQYIGL